MTKLLHIIATPRPEKSNTLPIAKSFMDEFLNQHPGAEIRELDLFSESLPAIAGHNVESKYTLLMGKPISPDHSESWSHIEALIQEFLSADVYLISTPMWNFTIPYALKYYIDSIVQPGYLFRFNEQKIPEPLVHGKKMVCITSTGSDYSENSPLKPYNFVEPYLRSIFGFVGIYDMQFITAGPMDYSPEIREGVIAAGVAQAKTLASTLA